MRKLTNVLIIEEKFYYTWCLINLNQYLKQSGEINVSPTDICRIQTVQGHLLTVLQITKKNLEQRKTYMYLQI